MKSNRLVLILLILVVCVQAQDPFVPDRKCDKNSDCDVSVTGLADQTCATIEGNSTLNVEQLYNIDGQFCIDQDYCGYVIDRNGTGPNGTDFSAHYTVDCSGLNWSTLDIVLAISCGVLLLWLIGTCFYNCRKEKEKTKRYKVL